MDDLSNKRFLIVDDMSTMRKMLHNTLKQFGIKDVLEAKDGKVACDLLRLEAAKGTPFHFIISDWNMPEMSGLELLAHCRTSAIYKDVAFILVTAEADTAQTEKAKAAGVDSYLTKPLDNSLLKDALIAVRNKRFPGK